jgi:hypothetical protein
MKVNACVEGYYWQIGYSETVSFELHSPTGKVVSGAVYPGDDGRLRIRAWMEFEGGQPVPGKINKALTDVERVIVENAPGGYWERLER